MKPAAFEYHRPATLSEALALLADQSRVMKPLAGGQSLVPMLNLRLAPVDAVVDISRLGELAGVRLERGVVRIGACTTHAAIEDGAPASPAMGLMRAVAGGIAYRGIRNRGTLGGSLALADPAAEWPAALLALDASVRARGPREARDIAITQFFHGAYTTALSPQELIIEVSLPARSASLRAGFEKICRKAGEFASSLACVVRDPVERYARAVLGGTGGAPLVLAAVSELARAPRAADAAAVRAAALQDLAATGRAFDDYERQIHSVCMTRAFAKAFA